MKRIVFTAMLCACAGKDDQSGLDGAPPSIGERSSEDPLDPDNVPPPSNGECPDLTQSHTTSFSSSGRERVVTAVVPDTPPDQMPLVFFFHGLLDPSYTPEPTDYMARALSLQSIANQFGVAFILPQSEQMSRFGFNFFMWAADEYEGDDVILYDDLRSCASDQLDIDLHDVHAMGFSGGGLFTTVIARDRGNTLASIVEMSGGSDIDMLTFDDPLSAYGTPARKMPALLMSGGSTDAWPGGGLSLVNFSDATDTLENHLVDDGHFVVRCEHDLGHQVSMTAIGLSWDWIQSHRIGEPSPFEANGLPSDGWNNWCDVVQ